MDVDVAGGEADGVDADDEVVPESLFVDEELDLPLPSLFASEPPPSFFSPAVSLDFEAFGSFNLFE